jgi:hypothetical protein
MAGWFPGVQRFVLISRLAVCSVGEDDYTLQHFGANNTIATRHARTLTWCGVRERASATANTSLYINKYDVQNNALAGLQIEKCEFARSLAAHLRLDCVRSLAPRATS